MLDSAIKTYLLSCSLLLILLPISNHTYNNPTLALKEELLQKINAGIPEWMTKQITKDLAEVPRTGITREMIEQTIDQDPEFLAKFTIKDNKITIYTRPGMVRKKDIYAFNTALKELSSYIKLPDVEFLFNVDDAPGSYENMIENNVPPISRAIYYSPVLVPSKLLNDKNAVMIPDAHTLVSMEFNSAETHLGNTKYLWNNKIPKAFWRGATTGGIYYPETYNIFPRVKLVQLSNQYPEIMDAKFNAIFQDGTGHIQSLFPSLGYMGNTLNISDHMQYKYQILIDGNSAAWTRCYWQLHCNSVMLKQTSNYIQWFHSLLKPYVHYIPVDYYCADLLEKIQWAKDNDDKVQQITKNANNFAEKHLQYSDMLLYIYAVITAYAKLQTFNL